MIFEFFLGAEYDHSHLNALGLFAREVAGLEMLLQHAVVFVDHVGLILSADVALVVLLLYVHLQGLQVVESLATELLKSNYFAQRMIDQEVLVFVQVAFFQMLFVLLEIIERLLREQDGSIFDTDFAGNLNSTTDTSCVWSSNASCTPDKS